MRAGVGADGRQQFVEGKDEIQYSADLVILALGFSVEAVAGLGAEVPSCTDWGTVQTQFPDLTTNLPDVFAAGDVMRGASLVVWAVRDGRDAAAGILKSLEAEQMRDASAESVKKSKPAKKSASVCSFRSMTPRP